MMNRIEIAAWLMLILSAVAVRADESASAQRGWRLLRTAQYLPPDFDQQVFDELWKVWPEPDRSAAAKAGPEERRRMTFSRYGLMEPPDGNGTGPALGYVDNGQGGWVMNCLACHGGKVAGRVIPGLPNSHYALHSLSDDVRLTKLRQFRKPGHMDLAALQMPLGTTHGTTNSVIFGVVLGSLRDRDMRVDRSRPVPPQLHHDMDAPPFWNVKKKKSLYADGFAPKNHRVLMQFLLLPSNGPDRLSQWEEDYRSILAWIESVEAPRYPFEINQPLAERGRVVFEHHCARCHGTYGPDAKYEQPVIPLDEIGTDPARLNGLTPEHRQWMKDGWMSHYGADPVETHPKGYVAPPLDGIWASAPYFHNGSVPTLWHVLHPAQRPVVWKRTEDGYDQQRVGLDIEELGDVPESVTLPFDRRRYFDTRSTGKSAAGHLFPEQLREDEKQAVLEYLKTL